jgi:asparagine synthase (glutamine-hydrolysing)
MLGTRAATAMTLSRLAVSHAEQARVPMPDRLQMYDLVMRLGPAEVLTPAMLARFDTTLPRQLQRDVWQATPDCSALNHELAFDRRFTLAESDLPKVLDAAGHAGVTVGFPMLDGRLSEFALKPQTANNLKDPQMRWLFMAALRGLLPAETIRMKRQGFGLPFGAWANNTPALKALATESLESPAKHRVVRADFVHRLLTQRLAEHTGYFGEMVWILMMLEQWLLRHAHGSSCKVKSKFACCALHSRRAVTAGTQIAERPPRLQTHALRR